MFTSNSNMDHQQQHQPQQPMFERPFFENDINPNPKQDISFSFFQFSPSSCFFDNEDAFFHDLQHHLLSVGSTPNDYGGGMVAETKTTSAGTDQKMALVTDNTPSSKLAQPVSKIMNKINTSTTNKRPTTQRKRTGKKDRHSKILTAQGPRDRRMRLNVETAGKFFNVQDMLGVDKASKTVEWLLNMCEPAIKELTKSFYRRINEIRSGSKSTGSSSMSPECEVQSEIDQEMAVCEQDQGSSNLCKGKSLDSSPTSKGKNARMSRKATFHPRAKELRAKARERARERTMEKLNSRRLDPSDQYLQGNPNSAFRSLSDPCEKSEDSAGSAGSHDMKSSVEVVHAPDDDNKLIQNCQSPDPDEPHETTTTDGMEAPADEQSFMITRNLNPTSMYSYHHREIGLRSNGNRIAADFSEIWDITNNAAAAGTSPSYSSMTSNLDLLPAVYKLAAQARFAADVNHISTSLNKLITTVPRTP